MAFMGFILLLLGVVLYFLPTIVANYNHRDNCGAILALNLLLGWTFLGWVVALVWALTDSKRPAPESTPYAQYDDHARGIGQPLTMPPDRPVQRAGSFTRRHQ